MKSAESVAVSGERAGYVKLLSDNIALIVLPDSNTVDAQALLESMFQYINVPRPYIWGLQVPSPLCRGM